MNIKLIIDEAKKIGIDELKITSASSKSAAIKFTNGLVSENETSDVRGVSITGIINGVSASISVADFSDSEIVGILPSLKETILLTSKETEETFLSPEGLKYENVKLPDDMEAPRNSDLINILKQIFTKLDEVPFILKDKTDFYYGLSSIKSELHNSKGISLAKSQGGMFYLYVMAFFNDGIENSSGAVVKLYRNIKQVNTDEIIEELKKLSKSLLPKKEIQSGDYEIIFEQGEFMKLLRSFLTHISARQVIDKRSVFADKLGEKIASPNFTLVDAPMMGENGIAITYDTDGYPTKNQEFISEGILKSFVHNKKTAEILKMENTGNSAGQNPSLINPYIKPGEITRDEIISKVKSGVLITKMSGLHSGINVVTGDFSIEIGGSHIKDGGVLRAITSGILSGNFFKDVLNNIALIGDDVDFAKQASSPTIMIGKLPVSTSKK